MKKQVIPFTRNIFLTGFMTAGKTTIGRLLARKIDWPFVDLDKEIEKRTGHRVSTLFRTLGEAHFRELEAQTLAALCRTPQQVIALGGGALLRKDNLRKIRKSGLIIHLSVKPESVLKRLRTQPHQRPLLAGLSRMQTAKKIGRLLAQRRPGFRSADFRVPTDHQKPTQTVITILNRLQQRS